MTTSALLAALLGVSAVVAIPVQPVPVTLQVFVVVLIALLVPPGWAALSVGAYLLVGAIGLPVFAHMTSGFGVLFGPTGGYLLGFLAAAAAGSWLRERFEVWTDSQLAADIVAAATVVLVIYAVGWAQLVLVTLMSPLLALLTGVVPFLFPDVLKAAAAVAAAGVIRRWLGPL